MTANERKLEQMRINDNDKKADDDRDLPQRVFTSKSKSEFESNEFVSTDSKPTMKVAFFVRNVIQSL